jgi:hypothetical protein
MKLQKKKVQLVPPLHHCLSWMLLLDWLLLHIVWQHFLVVWSVLTCSVLALALLQTLHDGLVISSGEAHFWIKRLKKAVF